GVQQIGRLATDAAHAAISADRPDRAVELLEQARAVLFTQSLDGRTAHRLLRRSNGALADRLREIESHFFMADLESAGTFEISIRRPGEAWSPKTVLDARSDAARSIRTLAAERDRILADPQIARQLRPPTLQETRIGLWGKPVVVLIA